MRAIGAVIEIDDLANMYATIPGSDPDAKRIVMASHCDSVKNGGNYDGILGVISAMEVLETVCLLGKQYRKPDAYVDFSLNMEDYYRIRDKSKAEKETRNSSN